MMIVYFMNRGSGTVVLILCIITPIEYLIMAGYITNNRLILSLR